MESRNSHLLSRLRNPAVRQHLALFTVSIYLAILLVQIPTVIRLDILVYQFFEKTHPSTFTPFILLITHLGGTYGFILFLILMSIYYIKQQTLTWKPLGIILGLKFLTLWLKPLIARPRPDHGFLHLTTYSMPSGHAVNAGLMGSFLIILILKSKLSVGLKIVSTLIGFFLMFAIGFSRIYLGVHYLSDVMVGLLCGVTGVVLFKDKLFPLK